MTFVDGIINSIDGPAWRKLVADFKAANTDHEELDIKFVICVEQGTYVKGIEGLEVFAPYEDAKREASDRRGYLGLLARAERILRGEEDEPIQAA